MADNVGYTPGTGATIAADDVGGVLHQRMKVQHGVDGTAVDTSAANPLPVAVIGELVEAVQSLRMAIASLARNAALPDTAGRIRANVETGSIAVASGTLTTVSTVTGVTTLTTLTNQTQIGGNPASIQIPALMTLTADNLRRNIIVT